MTATDKLRHRLLPSLLRLRVSRQLALYALTIAVCSSSAMSAAAQELPELLKTFHAEFVDIQPGTGKFPAEFTRGSAQGTAAERPVQKVTLTEPFAIAKYEMPQNLYEAVMGHNPSRWKGPRNSVELMTWPEAVEFCRKATDLMRKQKLIGDDEEVRLPTEIEWEYCCRAGTTTGYSFGDEIRRENDPPKKNSILDEYGWYTGNAAGNDPPVGALKPNPWGLYDMHGYLWEFTSDAWTDTLAAEKPATARPERIVLRGGSWKDPADRLTSSFRRPYAVTDKDDAVGFRCVKAKTKPQTVAE